MPQSPSFTRQHFEFIADVLKRARTAVSRTGDTHVAAQFDAMFVPMVAEELAMTNPRFDKARFIEACGVKRN